MFKLTNEELIKQRVKHPATLRQLKKDYIDFGSVGQKIIDWITYFDQADIHDSKVYNKINEFLRYIKLITPDFCYDEKRIQLLRNLDEEIKWISYKFSDNSIVDEFPIFALLQHTSEFKIINASSAEEILNEIVYWTRFMLTSQTDDTNDYNELLNLNLRNFCKEASKYIYQLACRYHLNSRIVKIPAAFSSTEQLYDVDMDFHYFVIIKIDAKKYIVDCTYSQFFSWYRNEIEYLGYYCHLSCVAGIYMLKDHKREKLARTILKNGWIELTEDTIKYYLDGFALSYRNGLYYEYLGVADYKTSYDIETYHNFLFGDDSQLKREGRKYLGLQMKLLKNSNFKF